MSDFKTRLNQEKKELDEKITKLDLFVLGDNFEKIEKAQQMLLRIQLNAMATYSQVLEERLSIL